MLRVCLAFLTVTLGVALLAGPGTSQEKKPKGTLPPGWKKLELTKDQEIKIRAISVDYQIKIIAVEKQIAMLKTARTRDQVKVLNEAQKEKLKNLILGEPGKEKTNPRPAKEK